MQKWRKATITDLIILAISIVSLPAALIMSAPSWLIAISGISIVTSFSLLGICAHFDERTDKHLMQYLLIDELDTIRELK